MAYRALAAALMMLELSSYTTKVETVKNIERRIVQKGTVQFIFIDISKKRDIQRG